MIDSFFLFMKKPLSLIANIEFVANDITMMDASFIFVCIVSNLTARHWGKYLRIKMFEGLYTFTYTNIVFGVLFHLPHSMIFPLIKPLSLVILFVGRLVL